ncbi:hypothetical protein WA1_16235 [Scytonema hofmannii PCC 7110]|uniref:Uncharacterized protein n=1 Tax=Scytonema hofmannii PCC 7110 TaxID=128403 RepID=A0A139XA98_9CYAN|nr:hypothetical protein [Scytonema hofmannii]KYC41596.1 hypothetical protein WA1_16235 [Scytonema hofmannii PCC 7110]
MGRWTPLILMAGGLAILLGTLLGISFPMGGQNTAQGPAPAQRTRASRVLPANINVNSSGNSNAPRSTNNNSTSNSSTDTANDSTDSASRDNVAQVQQQPNNAEEQIQEGTENTPNTTNNQSTEETNQQNEPIRALW